MGDITKVMRTDWWPWRPASLRRRVFPAPRVPWVGFGIATAEIATWLVVACLFGGWVWVAALLFSTTSTFYMARFFYRRRTWWKNAERLVTAVLASRATEQIADAVAADLGSDSTATKHEAVDA